jgi:hypothetical protein
MFNYHLYVLKYQTKLTIIFIDIRRFSDHEKELVAEMLKSKLAPKEIAKNINEKRKERGVKGLAIAKDVLNLASSLKKAKVNVSLSN